ncbi:MAG: sugar nucleotide-binding protein, partial [Phycisphaerae bacterium]|nr:sugar nucleotide-binding protein [Gemmatimonadaceae bacterium]
HNFVTLALRALRNGERWRAPDDQLVSPTYVPDLVQAALDLLIDGEGGIWHLANRGAVSWAGFAQVVAEAAGLDTGLVEPISGAALGQVAVRPRYSALETERGMSLPKLLDGVERYLADVEPAIALLDAANDLAFVAPDGGARRLAPG